MPEANKALQEEELESLRAIYPVRLPLRSQ